MTFPEPLFHRRDERLLLLLGFYLRRAYGNNLRVVRRQCESLYGVILHTDSLVRKRMSQIFRARVVALTFKINRTLTLTRMHAPARWRPTTRPP